MPTSRVEPRSHAVDETVVRRLRALAPMYRRILSYIADAVSMGRSSSRQDLQALTGLSYPADVSRYVKGLERAGGLEPNTAALRRSHALTREGWIAIHRASPFGGTPLLDGVPHASIPLGEIPGRCPERSRHLGFHPGCVVIVLGRFLSPSLTCDREAHVGDELLVAIDGQVPCTEPALIIHGGTFRILALRSLDDPGRVLGRPLGVFSPLSGRYR